MADLPAPDANGWRPIEFAPGEPSTFEERRANWVAETIAVLDRMMESWRRQHLPKGPVS